METSRKPGTLAYFLRRDQKTFENQATDSNIDLETMRNNLMQLALSVFVVDKKAKYARTFVAKVSSAKSKDALLFAITNTIIEADCGL